MAAHSLALGIDVGTTSIKAVLLDTVTRQKIAVNKVNHIKESKIKHETASFYEQNSFVILQTVDQCVAGVLEGQSKQSLERVSNVKISGQMHGIVLWSNNRSNLDAIKLNQNILDFNKINQRITLTTNLITWEDKRCSGEFMDSLPASKSPIHSGYGSAALFWLNENDPSTLKKAECAGCIMDLLVFYICNLKHPVMSDQIAHSWGYYNEEENSWQSEIFSANGLPLKLLPNLCKVGSNAGQLIGNWHGIPKGAIVKVAMGDFQCAVFSSYKETGTAVLNIGTSSQLAMIIPKTSSIKDVELKYPALQIFPYFDDCHLAVAASLNGGNVLDHLANVFKSWLHDLDLPNVDTNYLHQKFKDLCQRECNLTGDNLKIIPTIHGERHCPSKSATVYNIRPDNLSLVNVIKQLHFGIIENLFEMMPIECLKDLGAHQIACTGSLFINNEDLKSAIENMSGFSCILKEDADAVFGAALALCA